jgi:hypothetical protein
VSLLTLAQDVCYEVGIGPPSTIINNEDDDAARLLALFNTEGKRLMRRYTWQALTKEATFTTVATESQGALSAIATDIDRILGDTMWNRTAQREQMGANAASWQNDKARNQNRLEYQFRIRGGELLLNPTPSAGNTVAFEYVSSKWVDTSAGGAAKTAFTVDTDVPLLDEDVLKLGVKWRLRAAIGADYQIDLQEYQEQLRLRFGADTPKGVIRMGSDSLNDKVGVIIARSV